jgi:hypothetical protein
MDTCFGEYRHHQVLKYLVGKMLVFIVVLLHVWDLRCACVLCVVYRAPCFCCVSRSHE